MFVPLNTQQTTSNKLLLQYCHVSVYIPFGLTFQLHSQKIWFTLSPSRHITYIRGICAVLSTCMVSVTWLVLRACSWPAQLSASVCIFKSAFRNQFQFHVLFRVFLLKTDLAAFFPCSCYVECQLIAPDVFIHLSDSFPTFNFSSNPYPLQ